jgi:hypothetical protein
MYNNDDMITIPELARRLKIRKEAAYEMAETAGFPLYNLGGPRQNKTIWGDALDWIRENCKANIA